MDISFYNTSQIYCNQCSLYVCEMWYTQTKKPSNFKHRVKEELTTLLHLHSGSGYFEPLVEMQK